MCDSSLFNLRAAGCGYKCMLVHLDFGVNYVLISPFRLLLSVYHEFV